MKALDYIATTLGEKGDKLNQDLADEIIKSKRNDWVKELVENLQNKNKRIQSDCIKVLYEIGERGYPEMIAPYTKEFGLILTSKNNRLVWGAMTALDMIAGCNPEGVYKLLTKIIPIIDKGSVITIDHGVGILSKLSSKAEMTETALPLLIEQLKKCPIKQLPMYTEKSIIAINSKNKEQFINLLSTRFMEFEKESQIARINKVLKRLNRII